MHPILEQFLDRWVWPTMPGAPGAEFRLRLTREKCVKGWEISLQRTLGEIEEELASNDEAWKKDKALRGYAAEGVHMSIKQMSGQLLSVDSGLAYYVFSLRNLATYPHSIRIAALNLGPKILELGWMEGLTEALADAELKGVFESQFVENRSHINMGRRVVEEFVGKPVDGELCRWACAVAKRDYNRFLGELSAFVLGRDAPAPPPPRRQVTD